jgi:hypothetical protein
MVLGEHLSRSFFSEEVAEHDFNCTLMGLAIRTPIGIFSDREFARLYCFESADDIASALRGEGPCSEGANDIASALRGPGQDLNAGEGACPDAPRVGAALGAARPGQ